MMSQGGLLHSEDAFDSKIANTKTDFNKLKDACNDIDVVFDTLHIKVGKLTNFYDEFIKTNTSNLMIFGLDSFNFQNRLINQDVDNMKHIKNMLFNRIYADYYKLYHIMVNYIKQQMNNSKLHQSIVTTNKTFPKYNYLNITEFFDFSVSNDVFYEIIGLLQQMYDYCKQLDIQLQNYKQKRNIGLNIDNFIHTHEYRLHTLSTQINLYMNYVEFFIRMHTKYLQRFITRLKIVHYQLMEDIKLDNMQYSYNDISNGTSSQRVLGSKSQSDNNVMFNLNQNQVIIDSGVITKTELSPVEREEFKKMLSTMNDDSSELAKSGMTNLIESASDSDGGDIDHNICSHVEESDEEEQTNTAKEVVKRIVEASIDNVILTMKEEGSISDDSATNSNVSENDSFENDKIDDSKSED